MRPTQGLKSKQPGNRRNQLGRRHCPQFDGAPVRAESELPGAPVGLDEWTSMSRTTAFLLALAILLAWFDFCYWAYLQIAGTK